MISRLIFAFPGPVPASCLENIVSMIKSQTPTASLIDFFKLGGSFLAASSGSLNSPSLATFTSNPASSAIAIPRLAASSPAMSASRAKIALSANL